MEKIGEGYYRCGGWRLLHDDDHSGPPWVLADPDNNLQRFMAKEQAVKAIQIARASKIPFKERCDCGGCVPFRDDEVVKPVQKPSMYGRRAINLN